MAGCNGGGAEALAAVMVLLLLLRTAGASTLEESVQREVHIVYMYGSGVRWQPPTKGNHAGADQGPAQGHAGGNCPERD